MINRVVLMGRITQDLEVRQTPSGVAALTFGLAVERNYADQNGERQTDFITCAAWRQTAEFIAKYFGKGRMIAVEGQLRTRTYDDKNGSRHYVTEVYVDSASFTGEKGSGGGQNAGNAGTPPRQRQNTSPDGGNAFISGTEKPPQNRAQGQQDGQLKIAGLEDFEEIFSDGGVPF